MDSPQPVPLQLRLLSQADDSLESSATCLDGLACKRISVKIISFKKEAREVSLVLLSKEGRSIVAVEAVDGITTTTLSAEVGCARPCFHLLKISLALSMDQSYPCNTFHTFHTHTYAVNHPRVMGQKATLLRHHLEL